MIGANETPLGAATVTWLLANVAIGVTLAIDAVLATLFQFRRFARSRLALAWGGLIGLTHWLFPMAGFAGAWFVTEATAWRRLVWAAGALLLAWHVRNVVRGALRTRAEVPLESTGFSSTRELVLAVLAVSWDALVSGPGKSAVADTWTAAQVWMSFPIVGLVVFSAVLAASLPATWLHRRWRRGTTPRPERFARLLLVGVALEVALFSAFASYAIVKAALGDRAPQVTSLALAGAVWAITVAILGATQLPAVMRAQTSVARRVLATVADA